MRLATITLLVLTLIVWGADEWESDYPNIAGQYEVIGRRCESGTLYMGRVTIPVFRIYFVEDGTDMEGTFLWRSDLDNDGRISGYIYPKGYTGKKPGLEALFARK